MTLQELINAALSDGGETGASVSFNEGQGIVNAAIASGATAEQISAMSGIPVPEINYFMDATGIQGELPTVPVSSPSNAVTTTPNPVVLPPIEDLGNNLDGFGNNPGQWGFSDKNPIITSAENVTQAAIPEILKPFLAQSVDASMGSMSGLTTLLARDHALTSPLNDLQIQAQRDALGIANGEGGFLPQAQNALREIADPTDIFQTFNDGALLMGNPAGTGQLTEIADGIPANSTAMNALESTANGDFLYGGQGFDQAVQASIRQALPNIDSSFALQGGSGAVSGGLRDAAVAEVTADAFARQFSNERSNQLSAANQLNNFSLSNNAQRLGASSTLAGLNQNAGSALMNAANSDRSRQFAAVTQLPQMGLLGSQITGQIGAQRQQQEERTKLGQVNAMQQLLQSSFGNVNPNAMFGNINSVQQNNNSALQGLGGALAGSQVGSLFEGSLFGLGGGPLGAIAGGLLGAFG